MFQQRAKCLLILVELAFLRYEIEKRLRAIYPHPHQNCETTLLTAFVPPRVALVDREPDHVGIHRGTW